MWRFALSLLFLALGAAFPGTRGRIDAVRGKESPSALRMSVDVAVVGVSGGAAETVAIRLSERFGGKVIAVMDKAPVSPMLKSAVQASKVTLVLTETVESQEQLSALLSSKTVVLIGDEGDDDLRGNNKKDDIKVLGGGETYWDTLKAKETAAAVKMFDKTLNALPSSAKELICCVSVDSVARKSTDRDIPNPFSGLIKASGLSQDALSKYRQFCSSNSIPFSAFRFGRLTGGVDGAEPLPFIGLPAVEPELHPSYVYQGVVLTSPDSNQYADTELCTRNALAESIVRKVMMTTGSKITPVDALVVSIEGNPPTEKEWSSLFQRMQTGDNVELLRIEFSEIKKPAALANWIVDSWFPQALIDADAATVLTGARPVRARKMSDSLVRIAWEELGSDLSVRPAGGLDIRLNVGAAGNGGGASLIVVRSGAGAGSNTGAGNGVLPGEIQMVDKLLEGVNKVVYKKQLASPAP